MNRTKRNPHKRPQKDYSLPFKIQVVDEVEKGGYCYLNMVTDAYSCKIVGYAVADNMEAESMIGALRMALNQK